MRTSIFLLTIGLVVPSAHSMAQQASKDPKPKASVETAAVEQDYSNELPAIPSRSPEESLKAIRLKKGFHAELVASEPLIRSPMAIDFDEYARAFIVELPEYNQYASQKPHGKGAIKRLVDSDGDGRYDQATVYVDNLDYPTAVACWDGGVFVGAAPDLFYCKDTDGDGRADVRLKIYSGFGQDKAGEGMLNSIRWRMDNRFHISTGLDGGTITAGEDLMKVINRPFDSTKPIGVRGLHLLLDPKTMELQTTSGGGQHGFSLDPWNLRAYVCGNSEPVHLIMYDGRYLERNPYLKSPAAAINIAPEGKYTQLMRVSPIEPWRILRTRLRSQGAIPGSDEGGKPSGFFTGATGITVYRGDAWPAEYRGELFVGEVANNLVYRARVEPKGIGQTAYRADQDAEFLASEDNWFRPVQFGNAPDGTLYVLDMYRQLIEGAAFLAPQILKHMDTGAGADQGRIYRIAPDGFSFRPPIKFAELSTADLVAFLDHPNGWHRDTASRLIFQRQDKIAVPKLKDLIRSTSSDLTKVHALYSLQGLSALDVSMVIEAFQWRSPEAKEHALRLSEDYHQHEEMMQRVIQASKDPDLRVRYQAAFSLGAFQGEEVAKALKEIAVRDGADPWMQLAILSSLGKQRGVFLRTVLLDHAARKIAHIRSMISEVVAQIGNAGIQEDLQTLQGPLTTLFDDPQEREFAEQIFRGLISTKPQLATSFQGELGKRADTMLTSMLNDALNTIRNEKPSETKKVEAVKFLANAPFEKVVGTFSDLLESKTAQPIQVVAMQTMTRFNDPRVPKMILEAWRSLTPALRATAIESLFLRPEWIDLFLDEVEKKAISVAEVDPARIALLQKHDQLKIRNRASKLFEGSSLAKRQEVVDAYQQSLELASNVDRGRVLFRKQCAPCHKLEGFGESIGADLNAIRDRGMAAVLLNILDPNREVKPQFLNYVILLESGQTLTGMIAAETANSLTIRKPDNTTETLLRIDIDEIKSTGLSFMPEGLEKQMDVQGMADLLAYLQSIK